MAEKLICPLCGAEAKKFTDPTAGAGGSYTGNDKLKITESTDYVKCTSKACKYHVLAKDHPRKK